MRTSFIPFTVTNGLAARKPAHARRVTDAQARVTTGTLPLRGADGHVPRKMPLRGRALADDGLDAPCHRRHSSYDYSWPWRHRHSRTLQRYALGQVVIDAVERSFMERTPERASGWGGAIASRRLRKAWWPRPATGNRTMYLAIRQIVGGAGPARRTQIRGPASAIMY